MKKLIWIGTALMLSACGGSSDDRPGTPVPPPTPAPVLDTFYTRLNGLVGAMSDDTEPQDVSAVSITEPENTEPVGG
jgi:hypothetical protein